MGCSSHRISFDGPLFLPLSVSSSTSCPPHSFNHTILVQNTTKSSKNTITLRIPAKNTISATPATPAEAPTAEDIKPKDENVSWTPKAYLAVMGALDTPDVKASVANGNQFPSDVWTLAVAACNAVRTSGGLFMAEKVKDKYQHYLSLFLYSLTVTC